MILLTIGGLPLLFYPLAKVERTEVVDSLKKNNAQMSRYFDYSRQVKKHKEKYPDEYENEAFHNESEIVHGHESDTGSEEQTTKNTDNNESFENGPTTNNSGIVSDSDTVLNSLNGFMIPAPIIREIEDKAYDNIRKKYRIKLILGVLFTAVFSGLFVLAHWYNNLILGFSFIPAVWGLLFIIVKLFTKPKRGGNEYIEERDRIFESDTKYEKYKESNYYEEKRETDTKSK